MSEDRMLLEVGRYLPDPRDPEGRMSRMEAYLVALSRELEELSVSGDDALRNICARLDALEAATVSNTSEGGELV